MEKQNDEWTKFGNPLIKQGNSYCVRIPISSMKEIKANEGDTMIIKMKKLDLNENYGPLEVTYEKIKTHPKLKNYSKEKILIMLVVTIERTKRCVDSKLYKDTFLKKIKGENVTKEEAEVKKNFEKLYNEIKEDYGENFYKEFILFQKCAKEIMKKNN